MDCVLVFLLSRRGKPDLPIRMMSSKFSRVPVVGDEFTLAIADEKGVTMVKRQVVRVCLGTIGIDAAGNMEHASGEVVEIELGLTEDEKLLRMISLSAGAL